MLYFFHLFYSSLTLTPAAIMRGDVLKKVFWRLQIVFLFFVAVPSIAVFCYTVILYMWKIDLRDVHVRPIIVYPLWVLIVSKIWRFVIVSFFALLVRFTVESRSAHNVFRRPSSAKTKMWKSSCVTWYGTDLLGLSFPDGSAEDAGDFRLCR